MGLSLDATFRPDHGQAVPLGDDILRVTANNPGPFTFHGTNSYVVGREAVCVIDPGPPDERHLDALIAAIGGRPVTHILVSHTHRDHSPLAQDLKRITGAVTAGAGRHRPARPLRIGETNPLDAAADTDFVPDITLGHGGTIGGDGWSISAVETPGHTANHLAFALEGSDILFSADHVMAWATSIVAPPDGAMGDYIASLDVLSERRDRIYYPGHGGPVLKPAQFVRALKTHRLMREKAILERLRKGDRTIRDMVKVIYADTDPRLHGAASLSVLAHLEALVGAGRVSADGEPAIDTAFHPI